jgi:hypothetical protein
MRKDKSTDKELPKAEFKRFPNEFGETNMPTPDTLTRPL